MKVEKVQYDAVGGEYKMCNNEKRSDGSMEDDEESPVSVSFDSKALDGLRGLASFHIMVLHVFMLSWTGINTYGQVIISLKTISFVYFTHAAMRPKNKTLVSWSVRVE